MKIKKVNELNEAKVFTGEVNIDPREHITVGQLVEYLRKNVPKETYVIFGSLDAMNLSFVSKDDMKYYKIEDFYVYENTDEEDGKYTILDEEEKDNVYNALYKNELKPAQIKGIIF
jgi:hypothetical protein